MTRPIRQGSGQSYAEVIGDPIAHSKSPVIHGFWLERLGIDAGYRKCHVRPGELAGYFAQHREDGAWRGCNVTIPHKEKVAAFLDGIDESARQVGAVNTVHRGEAGALHGTNTDVAGVDEALAGIELEGAKVCVIGAGGAARAAFTALARRSCGAVHVLARNPEKGVSVAAACGLSVIGERLAAGCAALEGSMLLINATQLGMTGQEPMPGFVLSGLDAMAEGALVFDMVYAPLETGLLAAARRGHTRTVDGLTMLIGQAAVAFEKFYGRPAPREHDAELRGLLTS